MENTLSAEPITIEEARAYLESLPDDEEILMLSNCQCLGARILKARGYTAATWTWDTGVGYPTRETDAGPSIVVEGRLWGVFARLSTEYRELCCLRDGSFDIFAEAPMNPTPVRFLLMRLDALFPKETSNADQHA